MSFMDLHRTQGAIALAVSLINLAIVMAFFLFATRNERKHQDSNKDDTH